jgi:hypothetical protein
LKEGAAMPESVGKIADVSAVSGNGTGPAKKRASASRRYHYEEGNDTVTISDEARKRSSTEKDDELPVEEDL